jgi:hypothetical protein
VRVVGSHDSRGASHHSEEDRLGPFHAPLIFEIASCLPTSVISLQDDGRHSLQLTLLFFSEDGLREEQLFSQQGQSVSLQQSPHMFLRVEKEKVRERDRATR